MPVITSRSGRVAKAHHALVAVLDLDSGVLVEEAGNLGLNRLREQGTRPTAQDFGELVFERSWLNQSDDVIVRHGIAPSMEK
jgi:hypothetical protein